MKTSGIHKSMNWQKLLPTKASAVLFAVFTVLILLSTVPKMRSSGYLTACVQRHCTH